MLIQQIQVSAKATAATPTATHPTTALPGNLTGASHAGNPTTKGNPSGKKIHKMITGAQMIRTAAILQLLLGNIGRPGGGIMALRGHASIQGSTDIPTLFNILPGYLPMQY